MNRFGEASAATKRPPASARRWAVLLALAALLLNQALLPALHLAHRGIGVSAPGIADLSAHAGHHRAGAPDQDGRKGDDGPQSCHFCRLSAAALPPPSDAVIAVLTKDIGPAWRRSARGHRPEHHFGAGHPPRGPPLLV